MLYHLGLSPRDTSLVLEVFQARSYETVRGWYQRAIGLFLVEAWRRRTVAVDETKVKVQGRWLDLRAAVDAETWEVLAALGELAADDDKRVIIFRGAGERPNVAGADVKEFAGVRPMDQWEERRRLHY